MGQQVLVVVVEQRVTRVLTVIELIGVDDVDDLQLIRVQVEQGDFGVDAPVDHVDVLLVIGQVDPFEEVADQLHPISEKEVFPACLMVEMDVSDDDLPVRVVVELEVGHALAGVAIENLDVVGTDQQELGLFVDVRVFDHVVDHVEATFRVSIAFAVGVGRVDDQLGTMFVEGLDAVFQVVLA